MTDVKKTNSSVSGLRRVAMSAGNALMAISERAYASSPVRSYEQKAKRERLLEEMDLASKGLDHAGFGNRAYRILFTH